MLYSVPSKLTNFFFCARLVWLKRCDNIVHYVYTIHYGILQRETAELQ